ncbi:HAD family acid phosphatase [Nocardioides conyzicola]|uniref:Acid phosphatase n=1 Tax=Nocardioides conyzicola TaxID=1651781 RepID=A0ABP8X3A9_9ACTN
MRISGRTGLPVLVATTVALAVLAGGSAPTWAAPVDDSTLTPKTQFTMSVNPYDGTVAAPASGADIPNIDSVKSTIRTYYNAAKDAGTGLWVSNKTTSPYITELGGIQQGILADLPATAPADSAVVFDVDATLLSDFDFEEATHYNYDSTVADQWVADHRYPAVAGMPALVRTLEARGYDVYGVTGRPFAQEDDTVANLTEQGYTTAGSTPIFDNANLFTKEDPAVGTVDCTTDGNPASCSTVERKAAARSHIESGGDNIVLNVGDQWSDLMGGFAVDTVKLPNPTYFLASPDIAGAPSDDALMKPPTAYTMKPDGSSGTTVASGDAIPNLDPLRKEIRAYYNAPAGLANRSSSSYITELAGLQDSWGAKVEQACENGTAAIKAAKARIAATESDLAQAKKQLAHAKTKKAKAKARKEVKRLQAKLRTLKVPGKPAAVFDADDTTLWTYDMEDKAMGFNFDPALQDTWVQDERFAAVPGMPELVADVADAGCTVFGLTGRSNSQKYATLGNLAKVGYSDFRANRYFTKWNSGAQPPAYIDCGSDNTCSTIEYKSQTRKHIEAGGYKIVGNFGDQFSDLIGGYANRVFKLPNPTYYLP